MFLALAWRVFYGHSLVLRDMNIWQCCSSRGNFDSHGGDGNVFHISATERKKACGLPREMCNAVEVLFH